MSMPKSWLDVTDDIPVKVKVGQVLVYDFEGSPVVLKITSKKAGKIWARYLDPKKFLTPQEADETITIAPKN